MGILQNLFSGKSANSSKIDKSPEGFEDVFGPRPNPNDFHDQPNPSVAYRIAIIEWKQNKKYFKGTGIPPEFTVTDVNLAVSNLKAWGLETKFYEGRYGWMARFPKSAAGGSFREVSARTAIMSTHNVIAGYQMALADKGVKVPFVHPWIPPQFAPEKE